jgi:putative endonuclease
MIFVVPAKAGTQSLPQTRSAGTASHMVQKRPCVYILASRRNGTLYIGVTSNLVRRIHQHGSNVVAGFVQAYGVHRLVFAEFHDTMETAILREKRLKKWRRAWKLELIERHNPQWRDLYDELAV